MQKKLVLLIFILSIADVGLSVGKDRSRCEVLVIAKVVKIGEKPQGVSGRSAFYWMAKYSIVDVLKGKPTKTEVTVAHLVLIGNELDKLKIGDKILLCLYKCDRKLRNSLLLSADYEGELLLANGDVPPVSHFMGMRGHPSSKRCARPAS
jgi:hypothetical protein